MEGADAPRGGSGDEEDPPPRSFAKRVVDPLNSVAWFLMDALWMCKLAWPAHAFAAVTVVTGVWLLALGWRQKRGLLLADLGLNCWIVMNVVWMVADLNGYPTPLGAAVPLAVVGALFLALAAWSHQDFRRLRIHGR
ncbi:Uncharacterized protein OS=Bdellovibrio exovorus JSS GN=A11Q_2497 PE=4 SV=1 [Gemmataceae bacterium]|nr:Uncharacterized protein OS=Bdellovibrio exovorus JSS GN=A11Q_2497 PE=4 SV=1 [Gemmataceae bacterium]VTU01415.1 Uncharacterized protein OS=Bdellovibrio exovorus JSS GN=A11Q_2497 PE=4 SV=1 [Gemmataceae bacterium]